MDPMSFVLGGILLIVVASGLHAYGRAFQRLKRDAFVVGLILSFAGFIAMSTREKLHAWLVDIATAGLIIGGIGALGILAGLDRGPNGAYGRLAVIGFVTALFTGFFVIATTPIS
jgi:hypothetical protein